MLALKRNLVSRLRDLKVHIDVPDGNTVLLRNLPPNPTAFSKPLTNVLIKRPGAGMPFVVCVDGDLRYVGSDRGVSEAFAAAPTGGWRPLLLRNGLQSDLQGALDQALITLGFQAGASDAQPQPPADPSARAGFSALIRAFGTPLPNLELFGPTIGRDAEMQEAISCLSRRTEARLPLIVGESGVGKTNLLHGLAHAMSKVSQPRQIVSIDLAAIVASSNSPQEHTSLFSEILEGTRADMSIVLAVEHAELLFEELSHSTVLLSRFLDAGGRLIATTLPTYRPWFARDPLMRRIHTVGLAEPSAADMVAILSAWRDVLSHHHRVEIDPSCVPLCLKLARSLPGFLPGKGIALLDAAAARSAAAGCAVAAADDIYAAADGSPAWPEEEGK